MINLLFGFRATALISLANLIALSILYNEAIKSKYKLTKEQEKELATL